MRKLGFSTDSWRVGPDGKLRYVIVSNHSNDMPGKPRVEDMGGGEYIYEWDREPTREGVATGRHFAEQDRDRYKGLLGKPLFGKKREWWEKKQAILDAMNRWEKEHSMDKQANLALGVRAGLSTIGRALAKSGLGVSRGAKAALAGRAADDAVGAGVDKVKRYGGHLLARYGHSLAKNPLTTAGLTAGGMTVLASERPGTLYPELMQKVASCRSSKQ